MSEYEAQTQDAPSQTEVTARSVAEHLSSLLLSADTAAQRIVQEAEARAQQQLAEVEQRIRLMEAEAAKLAAPRGVPRRRTGPSVGATSATKPGRWPPPIRPERTVPPSWVRACSATGA